MLESLFNKDLRIAKREFYYKQGYAVVKKYENNLPWFWKKRFIEERNSFVIYWITPTHKKERHNIPSPYESCFTVTFNLEILTPFFSSIRENFLLPEEAMYHVLGNLFKRGYDIELNKNNTIITHKN